MNAINEYDVDDELPLNTSTNATTTGAVPVTKITRITKRESDGKEEEGKSIRKPRPKMDFNRLLKGNRGLGYLAVCAKKNLKLSGKPGSEGRDLSQICVYLQEWAKRVFPKMPLMEFLLKVEDICQSRLMKACVPELLSRLKEMGDNVDLKDLEVVEGEIMTRIATNEAEKAMESISAGLESRNQDANEDFNVEEFLAAPQPRTRIERPEFTDNESESESEDDEIEYARELREFIDDRSDESEPERSNNSESENSSETELSELSEQSESDSEAFNRVKKGITLNFSIDSEDEKDDIVSKSSVVNEEESAPVKKRNIAVIMDSDSD